MTPPIGPATVARIGKMGANLLEGGHLEPERGYATAAPACGEPLSRGPIIGQRSAGRSNQIFAPQLASSQDLSRSQSKVRLLTQLPKLILLPNLRATLPPQSR